VERCVPIIALHGINGESARNYHLINEESARGQSFRQELPAYILEFRPVRSKFLTNGNNSRISSSNSYIQTMPAFFKI
jgi:hypothetical protein